MRKSMGPLKAEDDASGTSRPGSQDGLLAPAKNLEIGIKQRLVACVQYGVISVSLTLFNRAVFSIYRFNFPGLFTMLQMVLTVFYLGIFHLCGYVQLGRITRASAIKVAPLAFFWWLYVVSGVTALRYLNVPMFSVLRRSTTLLVVLGEVVTFGRRPSARSLAALTVMVVGAAVAGLSDPTFSAPGYFWVFVCVVATAVYLILIKALRESTGLDQNTMLLYNSVLALPAMAVVVIASGELSAAAAYPRLFEPRFVLFLLASASQAFLLNLAIFRCTLINSPLATSVTGQVKDFALTGLGATCFPDVRLTPLNVVGLAVGLTGSAAYSIVSYREATAKKLTG